MSQPTGSNLGQAIACAASTALPQAGTAGNRYTAAGNVRHAYVAAAVNHGRAAALQAAGPEARAELEAMDLAALAALFAGCGPVHAEAAYAYDPVACKARALGTDIGRAYAAHGAGPADLCCTLDLYALDLGAPEAVVVDMKGAWAAGDEWQLRLQALCVARANVLSRVRVLFAHAMPGGGWRWESAEVYEASDLDSFDCELADAGARWAAARAQVAAGHTPDTYEGPHCTYCKAARYCPAKNALIRSAATVLDLPQAVGELTMAQRADAWVKLRMYKPVLAALEKALKESAVLDPIALPSGGTVQLVPGNDVIDEKVGHLVLAQQYGFERADGAITRKLTKAGLARVLGDAEADRALELIRAAGGISDGTPSVEEVKPPKPRGKRKAKETT